MSEVPCNELPEPRELVSRSGTPDTVGGWKVLAAGLLTDPCCTFHHNVEISARYAWIHRHLPACFKWAGMAAIASHRVRLALFPLGLVGVPRVLLDDVDTIRATNNAIFADIFWAHLAYLAADDGIGRLRDLLQGDRHYAPVLAAFEAIDRARPVLENGTASAQGRRAAQDLVWEGNVMLLEHEQRALVQPHFDRLSCTSARLIAMGAATTFEARGVRKEVAYFTSFYSYSLTHGLPGVLRVRRWPRITRFDDRWGWIMSSVVPRFRRFDAEPRLVEASLRRILADARTSASMPCMPPSGRSRHPRVSGWPPRRPVDHRRSAPRQR
jgi:hypothetical protein